MAGRALFTTLSVMAGAWLLTSCGGAADDTGDLPPSPPPPAKTWTRPANLTDNISPDGQHAAYPQVAMDANGNALVVWQQVDVGGTYGQIFVSEYRNGSWTHPASLTDNISPDGQYAADPQAAMDANGNALVVWGQNDGTANCGGNACTQIFVSEYRNGSWTHPASLTDNISPDGQGAQAPQVAMDANGNAVVVWKQGDGATQQIFTSEYRGGKWTHPANLSDNISPDGRYAFYYPQVAMGDNGDAVVVWVQDSGTYAQTFVSEYRNGSWTHPASLTDNISPDGQGAQAPQVAMDANGNAVVVWKQGDGTTNCSGSICFQIFLSEYRNGSWAHPANLTDHISPDGQHAFAPQVAIDTNGNAVVVWGQHDGTTNCAGSTCYQIFLSEYHKGSWTHPASLTDNISPDGQHAQGPQVAMDAKGNALVVRAQGDGTTICAGSACDQIFASEYRNGSWTHPADLTDHISLNGQNAGSPQLAMDANGNAVVVWAQDDGTANCGGSACAQIFASEYR